MKKLRKCVHFKTIRFRLTVTVSLFLFGTFLFCWLANQLFLPKFYQHEKCQRLISLYTQISNSVNELNSEEDESSEDVENISSWEDVTLDDQVELAIEKLSEDSNISIYIIDWERFYSIDGAKYRGRFVYPKQEGSNSTTNEQRVIDQMGNIYGALTGIMPDGVKSTTLYSNSEYQIAKIHDNRLDSDYLELIGNISISGINSTIYMRCNYESIQESVKLYTRFLLYAILAAIVIGVIVMFWISDGFAKPIVKLSKIAREMSELKFETKYTGNRADEIGDLGRSVNILSEKLEETISELKSANNELQNDIEEKIQIDEMRKEFLSNVTHELKTPIALIQGYAEGLQDNINDDPESRDFYCEVIIDEANKMNNMVKKLLNLNQIEFGKNQIEFERFDIVDLIQSVLASNCILMEQKGVQLRFEPKESVYVWADEYMTQEVVTNYISNAIHHVDGERIIEVRLIKKDGVVRIVVRNTGNTIPEDELDKVWIKFYKVDKARSREYGGSGIGLSIVKAIMKSMHRDCGVQNVEDGVEFWFELDMKY